MHGLLLTPEREPHRAMRDIGFFVDLAEGLKALAAIEIQCMKLRREKDFLVPPLPRFFDEPAQDHRSNAVTPPLLEHGHSADVPVGQQPSGAYNGYRISGYRITDSALVVGERVNACRVQLVELDRTRHALLLDEDAEADLACLRTRPLPLHELDSDHRPKV